MTTARRLIFVGKDRSPRCLLETVQIPEIQEGEILCKILYAAVCKSDLHTLNGLRAQPVPSYLGHEALLEVVSHRRSDENLQPGQRVVFCVCDSCGECSRCSHGLPQKCTSLYKYGHEGMITTKSSLSGCYASHIILRRGTAVFVVPDGVPNHIAAPVNCSLATMVSAVSKIKGDTSRTILVQGCGSLGVYCCALLHEIGFKKIICCDRLITRLRIIKSFGGQGILAGEEFDKLESESVDIIIEACGSKDVIDVGLSLLRPGGTYILVGMVHPNSRLNLTAEKLIRKCLTITGIHNYAPNHLEEAINFLGRTATKYPWGDLIGPSYSLKDFEKAVREAEQDRFHRVLIDPWK